MNTNTFLKKVLWIKKRARRLRRAYPKDLANNKLAVYDAHLDWINFFYPATLRNPTNHPESQA